MVFEIFLNELNEHYYKYFEKGLKKHANQSLKMYLSNFDLIDVKKRYQIFFCLCQDYCDNKDSKVQFLAKRGNGQLPYELYIRVRDYLQHECKQLKMPHLRWFYEMYRNDKIGCVDAVEMLNKAYEHNESDLKTIELMFNRHIEILAWGCHHFPEGCIIEKEVAESAIRSCLKILDSYDVSIELKKDFIYFKRLYEIWWEYKENNVDDFEAYCKENNLDFTLGKVYYYI